jgi:hypothetical protein
LVCELSHLCITEAHKEEFLDDVVTFIFVFIFKVLNNILVVKFEMFVVVYLHIRAKCAYCHFALPFPLVQTVRVYVLCTHFFS